MGVLKMANSLVQTILDAETDAISLSEFMFRPSGFKVSRRLAPPIDTLNFYLGRFDNINNQYSEAITQANDTLSGLISNTATLVDDVVADAANSVNAAIEGVAIDANLINDALVVTVPTFGAADAIPRTQASKNRERISVKDFGAKGDGDQTTYTVPMYKSGRNSGYEITTQTADAIAFNKAIRYLRSIGGGALYVPKGIYYVYGYLEKIDFPCHIHGDGSNSIIKNCDLSPTNKHGYGIFVIQPTSQEEVSFSYLKLDGNAHVRSEPTSEFQLYPIVCYGIPRLRLNNITAVNSPIDCLTITMDTGFDAEGVTCFAKITDCYFEDSFRNTVTASKGHDIVFNGCTVKGGGFVHTGTNPRYCVDVEPNSSSAVVKTKWINCTFSHSRNVLVGGVWSDSMFTNCTFDGSFVHPFNIDRPGFPWLFQFTAGQWDIDNCKFIGRSDFMSNECQHYNAYGESYAYTDDSYLRIKNSTWVHSGVVSTGRSISIENSLAQLSMRPFIFSSGDKSPTQDVFIKNLRLVNVFDGYVSGGGTSSAFAVTNSLVGIVDIDGLSVEVDSRSLAKMPKSLFSNNTYQGIFIPTNSSIYRWSIKKAHAEGYYKRLPTYLGRATNSSALRDWGRPSTAPADTAIITSSVTAALTDGAVLDNAVTNKAVTGTATQTPKIADRTLGGFTVPVFKDCTMWGEYD